MNWFDAHWQQMLAVACVLILLVFGRKKILPAVKQNKFLLWLAFGVTAVCGLILGWALHDVMGWLTALPGTFGGIVSSIGSVIAVAAGWWSVAMLVELVRDLADGTPDDDARKAALWAPTLSAAGLTAVWGIVQNPRGLGTGITAAIIAVISIVALFKIVKSALAAKKGSKGWKWFAALISLLTGVLMIPLLAFTDAQITANASDPWPTIFRVLIGTLGLALLVGAAIDLKDKVPDAAARAFLAFGVPALFLFGTIGVGFVSDSGESGGQILVGSVR